MKQRSLKMWPLVFSLFVFGCHQLMASMVGFEFTGVVNSVTKDPGYELDIAAGQTFSGRLYYDASAALASSGNQSGGMVGNYNNSKSPGIDMLISTVFENLTVQTGIIQQSLITVGDNVSNTDYYLFNSPFGGINNNWTAHIIKFSSGSNPFSGLALPTTLNLTDYSSCDYTVYFGDAQNPFYKATVNGSITSLVVIPVPESSTYLAGILSLGILLFGWIKHRKVC